MGSPLTPKMTASLLRSYSEAALRNADELLVEASLLRDHGHIARAYFLAVACIEEAGKGLIAFDAQNRNLSDPAVCTKLKATMESHSHKINYSLGRWAMNDQKPREAFEAALELVFHLKRGRELSMYSDMRTDPDLVQTPQQVVRDRAAQDCIKLAENCLAHAHRQVTETSPVKPTPAQDRLFTMKSSKFQEILKNQDFWWFFIARMEAGQLDLAEAVLAYDRNHLQTGSPFRTPQ